MKEDIYITVAFENFLSTLNAKFSKAEITKLKAAFIAGWESKGIYENMRGF